MIADYSAIAQQSRYHRTVPRNSLTERRLCKATLSVKLVAIIAVLLVAGDAGAQRRRGRTNPKTAKPTEQAPANSSTPAPSKEPSPSREANATTGTTAAPGASKTTEPTKPGKPKVFDFTGLDVAGRLRTPQLLYFLERANEELERSNLQRKSFIPAMVKSVDEVSL